MDQKPDLQQKIIRYVIKNTPFGETKEVIKDLCKIINQLNPQDEVIQRALRDHNEEHLAVFRKPENPTEYIITSPLNSQEEFYVDQKNGLTVKVDHSTLHYQSSEQLELPQNQALNAFRDALEVELKAYLEAYFNNQLSGFYVMYQGDESNFTYYVGVSAKTINLPSFYCGDWVSRWEITSSEVTGDLQIQAHYYEEGNVQLKNNNKVSEAVTLDITHPAENAKLVIETMAHLENRHQTAMNKIYDNMPDLFFKAMRRVLPVTGTKMDWNVHAHKVAASLKTSQ